MRSKLGCPTSLPACKTTLPPRRGRPFLPTPLVGHLLWVLLPSHLHPGVKTCSLSQLPSQSPVLWITRYPLQNSACTSMRAPKHHQPHQASLSSYACIYAWRHKGACVHLCAHVCMHMCACMYVCIPTLPQQNFSRISAHPFFFVSVVCTARRTGSLAWRWAPGRAPAPQLHHGACLHPIGCHRVRICLPYTSEAA